jgi:hypothetical protein
MSITIQDDIPLPTDNRYGKGQKLPKGSRKAVESMTIGSSFVVEADSQTAKRRIGALRALIARVQLKPDHAEKQFSVRKEKDIGEEVVGIRVYRMENSTDFE